MKSILFIGNFLSKHKGTIGPSEVLLGKLSNNFTILKASTLLNKYLRLTDFIFKTLFYKFDKVIIDVYSSFAFNYAEIVEKIALIRNKKIILVLHGGGLCDLHKIHPQKVEMLFKKANKIITPSLFLQSYFRNLNFKINLIPNSIDTSKFSFKENLCNNFSILWVRGFRDIYNPIMAIKVLEMVLTKFPHATLTMIGPDGGLLNETILYADNKGIKSKINFVGSVNNHDLKNYIHKHHVFINTTKFESFGMSVMESASCGIPIVSTNVGELSLIWKDNEEILLTQNNTIDEMVELVFQIFSDLNKADYLRYNARKKAEKYDWSLVKRQWLELLNS